MSTATAATTSSPTQQSRRPGNWQEQMENSSAACLEYVKQHATRGDPASVVAAIDAFAATTRMMNVGSQKGAIVDAEIRRKQPLVMAELGGYTGYSAVRFASVQREVAGASPASHYYSFEYSPVFAARVREMVDIAGLSDQVTVTVGAFADTYQALKGQTVDIYFIDHDKAAYLPDTKLILESGTLQPGSLLLADNVLMPGAPDYLAFVETSPLFTTTRHEVQLGDKAEWTDAISVATFVGGASPAL